MSNYKRIFMDGYSYYLTMVTHARNPILIDNIDLLRASFIDSKKRYRYSINAIVILPDHIHMIITPEHATEYPRIIRAIKYYFSVHCDECISCNPIVETKEAQNLFGKNDFMNILSEMRKICMKRYSISKTTHSNMDM